MDRAGSFRIQWLDRRPVSERRIGLRRLRQHLRHHRPRRFLRRRRHLRTLSHRHRHLHRNCALQLHWIDRRRVPHRRHRLRFLRQSLRNHRSRRRRRRRRCLQTFLQHQFRMDRKSSLLFHRRLRRRHSRRRHRCRRRRQSLWHNVYRRQFHLQLRHRLSPHPRHRLALHCAPSIQRF